jgi:hypothetical protein
MNGRILPVRGLNGEEAEIAGADGSHAGSDSRKPEPWTRHARALIDAATREALQVRPSTLDVWTRIELTYGALNALGGALSLVPGRKNIVWITDGIPLELGPVRSGTGQVIDFQPMARQLSLAFERSQVAIYPAQQIMIGSPNALSDMPGSPRGDSTSAGLDSRQTLDQFAAITGGRRDSGKDIGGAVRQAMNDARWSYRAGYAPPPEDWDRKYHKLRITCTRKGVRVQAKSGYYAWPEARSSRMKDAMRAIAATPFDAAEIGLRGEIEHTAGGALRIRLRLDAGDIVTVPGDDRHNARLDLAILTYGQGSLQSGPTTLSPINPIDLHWTDADLTKALSEGIVFAQDLHLDAATTALRVVVRDDNGGTTGSLTLPVQQTPRQ